MASKKIMESGLTLKQERFCQEYVSKERFASGVESYAVSHGIDLTKPGKYNICGVEACKLLKNPKILTRIRELLDTNGLNDEAVDRELLFIILQNADMGAKARGIDIFNKLRNRIDNKLKVEHSGTISGIKIEIVGGSGTTTDIIP